MCPTLWYDACCVCTFNMQELLLDVVITCYACDVNFLLLYWVTAMLSGCLVVFSP